MAFKTYAMLCTLLVLSVNTFAYSGNNGNAISSGNLPLSSFFIENKGQLFDQDHKQHPEINFVLRTGAMNVYVENGALHYQFFKTDSFAVADVPGMENMQLKTALREQRKIGYTDIFRLDVVLEGANKNAKLLVEEQQNYHENYYLPYCNATAYGFRKVTYKNIYPNIDWVLYTKDGSLKYDFVVHEGGSVHDIKLRYKGHTAPLELNEKGSTAHTPLGSITEANPYTYEAETKKQVSSRFVVNGDVLGFEIGEHVGAIIIDPTVRWSTYYGGPNADYAYAVAQRKHSNFTKAYTYVAGAANSFDNLVLIGMNTHRVVHAGPYGDNNFDGFIAAFTAAPQGHTWATYYGGLADDYINAITCDSIGNIYIAGGTSSDSGIATGGAHQTVIGGQTTALPGKSADGFIAKLDTNGFRIWGSYYGGERWDQANAIALDAAANIYITGSTWGAQGMVTSGAEQPNNSFYTQVAFLAKFNNEGQRQWGTFYGGIYNTEGSAITCDEAGNIYFAGHTNSNDTCGIVKRNIGTPGTHQPYHAVLTPMTCSGPPPPPIPDANGFLAKFNSSGVRLWGTYYGGQADTRIMSIAYDSTSFVDSSGVTIDGMVYVGGKTNKSDAIASFGGALLTPPVDYGGFIGAFTPNGKRYWGTYTLYQVNDLIIDGWGALMACGFNGSDAVVSAYEQAEMQVYATFGGFGIDIPTAIAIDGYTSAVVGYTNSTTGIADPGAGTVVPQATFAGNMDAFLRRFDNDAVAAPSFVHGVCCMTCNNPSRLCGGNTYPVYIDKGSFITVQLSDSSGSFSRPINVGSGNGPCGIQIKIPDTTLPGTHYYLRAISSKPLMISYSYGPLEVTKQIGAVNISSNSPLCDGDTLRLFVQDTITVPGAGYLWGSDDTAMHVKEPLRYNMQPSKSGDYRFLVVSGACMYQDTLSVLVNPTPVIQGIKNNSPICAGDSLKISVLDTASGVSYTWSGPNGFNATSKDPVIEKVPFLNAGKYVLTYSKLGCVSKDSTNVVLYPSPAKPTASSNSPVCEGDTLKLAADNIVSGVSYIWTGPGGYFTQVHTPMRLGYADVAGTYYVRSKLYNCSSELDSIKVVVKPKPPVPLVSSNSPIKEGTDVELTATAIAGATYTWVGPNGYGSSEQNPIIKKVTTDASGTYHLLVNLDGCTSSGMTVVVVNEVAQTYFNLFPNPNKGSFTIKVSLQRDQLVPFIVVNEMGQEVYHEDVNSAKKLVNHVIDLPGSLANGVYFLKIRMDGNNRVIPFVLNK